ncbi:hypothetical protein BRADI_5g24675v3 [Brachypodium distachyon]|uniref:Reverse transcriptase zinc-binding domain-containing protein n=1 Tax=Brachypodium distachyon TaxID=15368 RepID=A0A2K2CJ34_BRADI|nr:hypothetical protein BRADI_5g24675v3 [Brachypodium distachyon]
MDGLTQRKAKASPGIPNDKWCPFCHVVKETAPHLLLDCPFSREVRSLISGWAGKNFLNPASWPDFDSVLCWWLGRVEAAKPLGKPGRKHIASLVLLSLWEIWKERNRRTFQFKLLCPPAVLLLIKAEAALWDLAGAGLGELVSGDDDVP